uniref:Uncharacterized protein n=1 Tax=Schizaphis graminum TaxID=13262 RepID=A0A2S2NBW5_SCHGA
MMKLHTPGCVRVCVCVCVCVEIAAQEQHKRLMCGRWRETGEFFILFLFVYPVIAVDCAFIPRVQCILYKNTIARPHYFIIVCKYSTIESVVAVATAVASASKVVIAVVVVVVVVVVTAATVVYASRADSPVSNGLHACHKYLHSEELRFFSDRQSPVRARACVCVWCFFCAH